MRSRPRINRPRALALLGATSLASAHHSAVQFDFTKQVPITGVVKNFRAINPHMQLTLEVKNANGSGVHDVEIEGHSTNNMSSTVMMVPRTVATGLGPGGSSSRTRSTAQLRETS